MDIHHEELPEIARFLAEHHVPKEGQEKRFQFYLRLLERFGRKLQQDTTVLEVGPGAGWLLVLFNSKGIACEGLEISPMLIANAKKLGEESAVTLQIRLGNIEEVDLGENRYDFIIASSVFEHVQHWERALGTVCRALKPGGLFYFASTNRFSFTSGEYNFPLYGWLPDKWRYKLRIARQGPEIMKLGIDFNQFRPWQLRRAFSQAGFSRSLDVFEYTQLEDVRSPLKKSALRVIKSIAPAHFLSAAFFYGNMFLCIK